MSATNFRAMAVADPAVAAAPSELGPPETGGTIGPGTSRGKVSVGPYGWQMAQAVGIEPGRLAPWPPRAASQTVALDRAALEQSCVDGGLQGVVPDPGWPAGGTLDCPGFIQPRSSDHPFVPGSELAAGAAGVSAAFWPGGLSQSHPRGQWPSLWIKRADGAFAFERLVDGFGDPRRIYCPGASRTEWRARTNAPGVQG